MMQKTKKQYLSLLLSTSLVLLLLSTVAASEINETDFSIDYSDLCQGTVIKTFEKDNIVYTDLLVDKTVVYLSEHEDGTVEWAYSVGDAVQYYKYQNGIKLEERKNYTETYSIQEELLIKLYSILQDENFSIHEKARFISSATEGQYHLIENDGTVFVEPITSNSTAATTFNVGISDLPSKYPILNQAYSSTYSFYCTPLGESKNVIIRDTRNNFIQTSTRSAYFSIGVSVVEIAASIWMSQYNVMTIFDIYLVGNELIQALSVNRGVSATSSRIRQGFIYDTTQANAYVSVLSVYGNDSYIVSNQGNGYDWGEVYSTLIDEYPNSYMGPESASRYNYNISTYGFWQWGNV
ncbi:MAG: hypothetical protein HUJ69_04730 [Lachnospiraceae bacterium]|nr:hypothetical protein [Lachnospiraceae bacterium]